jgi:pimeloyl-ACP methyl ester carboxylesterase
VSATELAGQKGSDNSAERAYPNNLIYFNEVDKGGHFAAWEQPQLFSEEMRAAFRPAPDGRSDEMTTASVRETNEAETGPWFGPLKQIDAGVLSVGYAEARPADGPPAVLLRGWPGDIHSYVDVDCAT